MKNSILYIVGAVALLGGGAYLFLKNKKSKDASKLVDMQKVTEVAQAQAQAQAEVKPTEKPISADDLLAVASLKDAIISDIKKRNSYSKASSRANVQSEIDKKLATLKTYGFGLDTNNQLIKIK